VSERPETAKGTPEVIELSKQQQAFARRVAESKATIPHLLLRATVEMTPAAEAGAEVVDLIVRACGLALREQPRVNSSYRDGTVEQHSRVNVGVVVPTGDAPVVPTIFDADSKALGEIAAERRELVSRAEGGSITAPELAGGTFTVWDLGPSGVRDFDPVIVPPQAANLGAGAIEERRLTLTLACDHRVLQGSEGADFLARLRELLEERGSL
jgi:pyruvate dehydrogenase E2 component (dihydrolipoamide acetyltransferase)